MAEQQTFPYTLAPSSLADFLTKLKTMGVPSKIDKVYLSGVGLKSSNHRAFIPIMKVIDLLDSQGVPTDRYRRGLRGGDAGRALVAEGIKRGYRALFDMYPDAHRQSSDTLTTFFSAHSDLGDRALSAAVSTFQTLCKFGSFDGDPTPIVDPKDTQDDVGDDGGKDERGTKSRRRERGGGSSSGGGSVTINVNIALSVDATSDASVYDAFFAAMAKHILVLGDDGIATKSS